MHPATRLYHRLIDCWNRHDATGYGDTFTDDGALVGFDGSTVDGREAVTAHLAEIFADHTPARYVTVVRETRRLSEGVYLVRAVAGMVPPGRTDLEPAANAVQSLVATDTGAGWRVVLFHNTPAAFHGRPEAAERLTAELREELRRTTTTPPE
ncbi:uncharacterized protein (TIGR02246 family) [Stackebrandtia albiflava]|uniref:Uncharacterized protein (TIGR02246 family) n=1 Tax=Stackebrandtia albiflava TaxID=406432 RepID=A0A562V249_9ACTN|nr:SgcJ/EcaC family oxidoreductase [Stackebrandtia albiflava]TWJ11887.1 uncharacterized protein (TIGR02246 family) [Stackebrandtia albiflava]